MDVHWPQLRDIINIGIESGVGQRIASAGLPISPGQDPVSADIVVWPIGKFANDSFEEGLVVQILNQTSCPEPNNSNDASTPSASDRQLRQELSNQRKSQEILRLRAMQQSTLASISSYAQVAHDLPELFERTADSF